MSKNYDAKLGISLLWKDYDYISKSLAENEIVGEKRINFFITLTTAIITAIVTLNTADTIISENAKYLTSISALSILLAIGIIILLRMIKRNKVTDKYKVALDDIRQKIKDISGGNWYLKDYSLLKHIKPSSLRDRKGKKKKNKAFKPRKLGSLTHLIAVLNSALTSVIIGIIIFQHFPNHPNILFLVCFIMFIMIFASQTLFIYRSEQKNRRDAEKHLPTHAGGVVYRKNDKDLEVMLVTAKNKNNTWVIPKGHIIKHEGHGECAIREVWEESGWITSIVQPIAITTYLASKEKIVKYYLMTPDKQLTKPENISKEKRIVKWMSFSDANEKLPKNAKDMKDVLALAYTIIQSSFNNPDLI